MSKNIKTKEALSWTDGYLSTAFIGELTSISSIKLSGAVEDWSTFETNYGTSSSLIGALNAAWSHSGWDGRLAIETVNTATYNVPDDGYNTAYLCINPTSGGDVVVSLPAAEDTGIGAVFQFIAVGIFEGETHDGMFVLEADGEDTIMWPGDPTYTSSNLGTQQPFSKVCLVSDGVSTWSVSDAIGVWGSVDFGDDRIWVYTNTYKFDGHIPGGVENNAVSIDEYGNIQDSGVPVGSGGGSFLYEVIMPTDGTPAPTSMDRGDEWFNVSYSASVISGFDILAYEPDDRLEPLPLTYKISIDAGEVCLRSTSDPDGVITIYSVAADEIYVTGPTVYIYVRFDNELGYPIITSTPSWIRSRDRIYGLLYSLTIYDDKAPGAEILESISLDIVYPSGDPAYLSAESGPIQLIATGTFIGGGHSNVSADIETWSTSDDTHITVTSGGLATAVTPGSGQSAYVGATIGDITGTVRVDSGAF